MDPVIQQKLAKYNKVLQKYKCLQKTCTCFYNVIYCPCIMCVPCTVKNVRQEDVYIDQIIHYSALGCIATLKHADYLDESEMFAIQQNECLCKKTCCIPCNLCCSVPKLLTLCTQNFCCYSVITQTFGHSKPPNQKME